MQRIYTLIEQVADLETTILITGESGTGKELVMEAIHARGKRCSGPLIRVNCSALPESLLESELFGHVKGAFSGAVTDRIGRFQAANRGTIFLDEIGDISPSIQLKLLRVLERKEFERVGESKTCHTDVRIIAATHVNLMEKVRKGEFREDFYYRLGVMTIYVPSLRERKEDIPMLTDHFYHMFSKCFNKRFLGISKDVLDIFMRYPWHGNIRELKYVMERATILCPGGMITPAYLPSELSNLAGFAGEIAQDQHIDLNRSASESTTGSVPLARPVSKLADSDSEREKILRILRETDGNKAKSARILGISRSTLYRKLHDLGMDNQLSGVQK
jgi:DNA-binding NtrC family response regulator